jgi:D-xylose transport system substrate-binding protein
VASVLLTPIWVTAANMKQTVVKDGFVDTKKLCGGGLAKDCSAAGIK